MKKQALIVLIFVLSIFVLLTSCERGDKQSETSKEATTPMITTEAASDSELAATPSESPAATPSESPAVTTEKPPVTTEPPESSTEIHVHSYGAWTTVKEATCKERGLKARICSCGDRENEIVDIISHNYVNGICSMCKKNDPNSFVSDYPAGQANVVGNDSGWSNYALQADYIYMSANSNKIEKIKTNGSGLQTVYKATAGYIANVNVVGDWIYFYCIGSTVGKSYIAKVRTDGSGFEKIVSSVLIGDMLVVKDTVYYTTVPDGGEYKDYAKDAYPLYSVSVNGGNPRQLHDGAVSDLVADSTYLYFIHHTEDSKQTISRIKHGSTSSSVLMTGKMIYKLSLENSKLYFFAFDKQDFECSLASISTNGGSYTEYGKVMQYGDSLHVVGNKAYYMGETYFDDEFDEQNGVVELDLTTKKQSVIREEYDNYYFDYAGDLLIFDSFNYDTEKLESITVYFSKANIFKKIKMS